MKNLEEYYKDNLKGIEVGDKVFDLAYGHGIVCAMRHKKPPYYYRIKVKFDVGRWNEYTKNGCVHTCYPIPILFFDKPNYDKDGYPIPQQKEEKIDNLQGHRVLPCVSVSVLSDEEMREPIENALYATKRFLTTQATDLAEGIIQYIKDAGYIIVRTER